MDISKLHIRDILLLKEKLEDRWNCEVHEVTDGFFSRLRDQQDDTMKKMKQWDLLRKIGDEGE